MGDEGILGATREIEVGGATMRIPAYYQQVDATPDDAPGTIALAAMTDLGTAFVKARPDDRPWMPGLGTDELVAGMHRAHGDTQGLVEVGKGETAGGDAYAYTLLKDSPSPIDLQYILSLEIAAPGCGTRIEGWFAESGTTGVRASAVLDMMLGAGKVTIEDGRLVGWARDPYDEAHMRGVLANLADDEAYDAAFPTHPLSLARALVKAVVAGG